MKRHMRDNYYVVGEGILTRDHDGAPICERPSTTASLRKFRFSRLGPQGEPGGPELHEPLAVAMTRTGGQPNSGIPAGFTYLGQFVDHDLTMDRTAASLGDAVTVDELLQGRSPALDLDSLYGRGPGHPEDRRFYASDGVKLRVGRTSAVPIDDKTNRDLIGFDLPRTGFGSTRDARRTPDIPDHRNDENLAVAQVHLAFIRFHNRVVDELTARGVSGPALFREARATVVRHYQWMLRTDLLPRIIDPVIVDDVFTNGRRFFEVPGGDPADPYGYGATRTTHGRWNRPGDTPTMPIEFSVAAYRLGHAMIRGAYQWNRIFNSDGPLGIATLSLLFRFSGTSGNLSPGPDDLSDLADPDSGAFETLPTNWIADFRRLFDFGEAGRTDLVVPAEAFNVAKRIDTLLVDPLSLLPLGSFGGRGTSPATIQRNLAFRNLVRSDMVKLASGQQMAELLEIDKPLEADQILLGNGGAVLDGLTESQRTALVERTPLWFYILREAELQDGRLTGVGGRIAAEVFHRAIEGSETSILRTPSWRPDLGPDPDTFRMVDLLLFAFNHDAELLNPLG
jgi:hypothetical protein